MKLSWKSELPQLAIIAGMLVLAALSWSVAPDRMPVHWNAAGEANRWGGKAEGLLLLPAAAMGIYLIFLAASRIDPGRENYERFRRAFTIIRVAILSLLAYLYVLTILIIRGVHVDMPRALGVALGALFVVMGATMGKLRPNWFVGIRTPWTLSSKLSWTRTHRLGGWLFLVGGIVILVAGLAAPSAFFPVLITVVAVSTLTATVYSYLVWRRDPDRTPPAGTGAA